MDLTQLANLGEFIGGVAVLVTLLYLAIQVQQTNRLTRAQVRQESARMSNELILGLDQDDFDLIAKASNQPNDLSASELRYVASRFLTLTNYYETLFYARKRGDVDEDLWESRLQRMANFLVPARETLWPIVRVTLGREFQQFVERTIFDMSVPQPLWARS